MTSLQRLLEWLGDVVGGFSAAFLVYVVVGSLLGYVLARPYEFSGHFPEPRNCWPINHGPNVWTNCESTAADAFWYGAVGLPASAVWVSAIEIWVLTYPGTFNLDNLALPVIFGLLSFAGFWAWRIRHKLVAWALIVILTAEIALGVHWYFYLGSWPWRLSGDFRISEPCVTRPHAMPRLWQDPVGEQAVLVDQEHCLAPQRERTS